MDERNERVRQEWEDELLADSATRLRVVKMMIGEAGKLAERTAADLDRLATGRLPGPGPDLL